MENQRCRAPCALNNKSQLPCSMSTFQGRERIDPKVFTYTSSSSSFCIVKPQNTLFPKIPK
eukprot:5304650-Amphidinium_carterae.1